MVLHETIFGIKYHFFANPVLGRLFLAFKERGEILFICKVSVRLNVHKTFKTLCSGKSSMPMIMLSAQSSTLVELLFANPSEQNSLLSQTKEQ